MLDAAIPVPTGGKLGRSRLGFAVLWATLDRASDRKHCEAQEIRCPESVKNCGRPLNLRSSPWGRSS